MRKPLWMCLLSGVAIAASGCKKSENNAAPAAGNASVMTTAGSGASTASPVTAAGTGTSNTAGVAGTRVPAAIAGADASSGQAGTAATADAGSGGAAGAPAEAGKDGGAGAAGTMTDAGAAAGAAGAAGAGGAAGGMAGAGGTSSPPAAKFPIRNLITGGCELTHAIPDPSMCTGWDEIYECVAANCELAECERLCADHVACAGEQPDPCDVETTCPKSDECDKCLYSVKACGIGPCELMFRCTMPSTDGACSRLNTCCLKQNDPIECSAWHDRVSLTLGDPGCEMFINDPGFLRAYVNDPPCMP